jgi:hypothetical protein
MKKALVGNPSTRHANAPLPYTKIAFKSIYFERERKEDKELMRQLSDFSLKNCRLDVEIVAISRSMEDTAQDILELKFEAWKDKYQGTHTLLIVHVSAHGNAYHNGSWFKLAVLA